MRRIAWLVARTAGALWAGTLVLSATPASASAQAVTWRGQIRPRVESRDPVLGGAGGSDAFTSMRVRLGVDATLGPRVSAVVEVQDVRLWGEETSPLNDFRADNFDMHQAFLRIAGRGTWPVVASVGRMETRLGEERLVGAVDWTQQGQVFDGARLDLTNGATSVALLAYAISDLSAAAATEDRQLYGLYGTRQEVGPGALEAFWLYDRARAGAETDEHSIGARYAASRGDVEGGLEATWQTGTRTGADVSAFMVGARIGTAILDDRGRVTLWYDYLSGNDPSTPEVDVFNTVYATNHRYYGFADLFTNIPAHTAGAGLQDLAAKLSYGITDDFDLFVDFHSFLAAQQGALSGKHFADEIDFTLTRAPFEGLGVTAGLSYVMQDDPLGEIGRLGQDQTWFYLMLNAIF